MVNAYSQLKRDLLILLTSRKKRATRKYRALIGAH